MVIRNSHPLPIGFIVNVLCAVILSALPCCKSVPGNQQAARIEKILSGIGDLNRQIMENQEKRLEKWYPVIEEDLKLIEEGFFDEAAEEDLNQILPAYLESLRVLSQCKIACTDLQKELSALETQLRMFLDQLSVESVPDSVFRSRLTRENGYFRHLEERMKYSLGLVELHFANFSRYQSVVDAYKRSKTRAHEERMDKSQGREQP